MQPGQQQVQQQASAPGAAEPEVKCCGCLEIACGLTTLMILEILYFIGFVAMLALVIFVGAAAKGLAGAAVDANAANMTAAQQAFANQATTTAQQANAQINAQINANLAAAGAGEVNTAGNAILYVGIGMIIAELPRVYYMCKL